MNQSRLTSWLIGGLILVAIQPDTRAETNALPHFQELFRLLRSNLDGTSEEDLNRAAVQGLLSHFYPRVVLVTNESSGNASATVGSVSQAKIYDESYGYLRVGRVGNGLAEQLASEFKALTQTNQLKGLVLDLRFAGGMDYGAAAAAADRFLTREQALLTWEDGSARSTAKKDAITLPLAILINQETRGAAEALAELLRLTDAAVLIGARTAGGAHVFKDFSLDNGQKLRIATGAVRVGEDNTLLTGGIGPDIEVPVNTDDEKAYFADAFKVLAGAAATARGLNNVSLLTGTNRPARRRINEAELVRRQREGQDLDDPTEPAVRAAARAGGENIGLIIRDPALARALDLLKGISAVERSRRP